MSDVLVSVQNVSKKFCCSLKKSLWYGVQDIAGELLGSSGGHELRSDEFWAVRDVGFELKRGECLGLIGRNGAGKTTLLRMLNGLIKPDRGRIEMKGRIGALIALGAGFNPILTGRENVFINATILGLTKKEISRKIDEIIDFAELGEFIDMPVQSYSSGMSVRLGFAVATALEPDVLMLDEVLAVGDADFRFKCHRRISEVIRNAAVIFVSHDMPHVARICDRSLVLDHGAPRFLGDAHAGIEVYRGLNEEGMVAEAGFLKLHQPITDFVVQPLASELVSGSAFSMDVRVTSACRLDGTSLRLNVYSLSGAYVADCVAESASHRIMVEEGGNHWSIGISSLPLRAGRYQISLSILDGDGGFLAVSYKQHELLVTGGYSGSVADCQLTLGSWLAL